MIGFLTTVEGVEHETQDIWQFIDFEDIADSDVAAVLALLNSIHRAALAQPWTLDDRFTGPALYGPYTRWTNLFSIDEVIVDGAPRPELDALSHDAVVRLDVHFTENIQRWAHIDDVDSCREAFTRYVASREAATSV